MIIFRPESMDFFQPTETPLLFPDERGRLYHPKGYIVPPEYLTSNVNRPSHLCEHLVTKVAAKKATRVFVPELDVHHILPQTVTEINLAYFSSSGSKTIYARNKGKPDVKYIPPSSGGITLNELSREFLRTCIAAAEGQVLRSPKRYYQYLDISAPQYYKGGRHHGQYAYVDISSAYWSIMRTSTIDMRFTPGQVVGTGRVPFLETDEVTYHRDLRMRHTVYGCLRTGKMQMCRNGKPEVTEFKGSLSFPGLVGYIMHVMHSIAHDMIDHFGALMVLTDGFIIPQKVAPAAIEFLRERYALTLEIKAQGDGAVYQQNLYQVGTHRSADAPAHWTTNPTWRYVTPGGTEMTIQPRSRPCSTLIETDTAWLQKEREILLKRGLGRGTIT